MGLLWGKQLKYWCLTNSPETKGLIFFVKNLWTATTLYLMKVDVYTVDELLERKFKLGKYIFLH